MSVWQDDCACFCGCCLSPILEGVLAYFYVQTNNSVATDTSSLPGTLDYHLRYKCNKLATDFD